MSNSKDLTKGSLLKNIFLLSVPLMFSNVLHVLFNMADVAVVGIFAGTVALGSVGSTATVVNLFIGFLIGIGGGVSSVVARHFGAGKEDVVQKSVHNSAIICLGLGLILMAIGLFFAEPLLVLMGTKAEFLPGATLYLRIFFLSMPAVALFNFGNGVLSAIGNTKQPLIYLSIAGVVNVILNLFFVIVCKMDVAGVATATTISQTISAILIILTLFKSKQCFALKFSKFAIDKKVSKELFSICIPAGCQTAIFHLANLFIQSSVNTFDEITVAGNAAAANADALVYDVMAAFYTVGASFVAQNFGAGNKKRVLNSYFISTFYAFAIGAIMGLLLIIFSTPFLSLFTSDIRVIQAGKVRLSIMAVSYAFSAFMDGTISASRGIGKTVLPTVFVIMGSCVFRLIWLFTVFAYFKTIESIYLLYIFSWGITALFEIVYFAIQYKKSVAILDVVNPENEKAES